MTPIGAIVVGVGLELHPATAAEMSRALQRTIDAAERLVQSLHPFERGFETAEDYGRCRAAVAQLTDAARGFSECLLRLRDRPAAAGPAAARPTVARPVAR